MSDAPRFPTDAANCSDVRNLSRDDLINRINIMRQYSRDTLRSMAHIGEESIALAEEVHAVSGIHIMLPPELENLEETIPLELENLEKQIAP